MSNTAKLHEYIVAASSFTQPPVVGDYYVSQSGGTTFQVAKVRRMGGDAKPSFRLIGSRLRKTDLPPDITIFPWPREQRGPSRAAEPAAMRPNGPIVTRAKKAKAERDKVVAIRRSYLDADNQQVDPVRVANGTVDRAEWKDPDDLSVTRRTARIIKGMRAIDPIDRLAENGSLNRSQGRACRRFRRLYETGEIGMGSVRDLSMPPGGYGSGLLPTEARSLALAQYQAVAAAIGRHLLEVALAIIIKGDTIQAYAERRRIGRSAAAGYFMAAADRLVDVFEDMDKDQNESRGPHTIGAQLGQASSDCCAAEPRPSGLG